MTQIFDKKAALDKVKTVLVHIRKNGLKDITSLTSYSLVLVLGVVTLGTCFLAGLVALIAAKLQPSAESETENQTKTTGSPVVAA